MSAKTVIEAAEKFDPWPVPDMSVLETRRPPPPFPADLLGPFWAGWLSDAAEEAGAPVDYVAAALLSIAGAAIGNARWSSPWRGWAEPPIVWTGNIGDPSSAKSPATDQLRSLTRELEAEWVPDFVEACRAWEAEKVFATVAAEKWKAEAKAAAESGQAPPQKPAEAEIPPKPERRRLVFSDITPEELARILSGNPKGGLLYRDELVGWLGNMNRYSGAGERQMWIEAYGGRPYTVDRVKNNGTPLVVDRFTVGALGGMQPDRLAEIMADADDGLSARFLWFWPAPVPPARPTRVADINAARVALRRLANLAMVTEFGRKTRPGIVGFSEDAASFLQEWRLVHYANSVSKSGAAASAWGKNPGHVVRLALVIEFLWWCSDNTDSLEPANISRDAVMAAIALVDDYVKPMTARALGDSAVPEDERGAANLAKWLLSEKPSQINLRDVSRTAGLAGLRDAEPMRKAAAELVQAAWLRPVRVLTGAGRPRGDFQVNPKLMG